MNKELEYLITMAIADGEVTEKERTVILHKAESLGLNTDEIEIIINGKLQQFINGQNIPSKEKTGNIKTCPACGSTVKAFQFKCEDCGHEFTGSKASKNVVDFFNELKNKSLIEQSNIISSYPIPSNKEDILEFLSLSIGNCKKLDAHERNAYLESAWTGKFNDELGLREAVINAWQSKTIQALNKGKTLFQTDMKLMNELNRYEKLYKDVSIDPIVSAQKDAKSMLKKILIFLVVIYIISIGIINLSSNSEDDKKTNEMHKLEKIENQILKAIEENNYNKALILNEQLIWTLRPNVFNEEVDLYNSKRKSNKELIEKIKNSNQ